MQNIHPTLPKVDQMVINTSRTNKAHYRLKTPPHTDFHTQIVSTQYTYRNVFNPTVRTGKGIVHPQEGAPKSHHATKQPQANPPKGSPNTKNPV